MKNIKIWLLYTTNTFQQVLQNRTLMGIFLFGKAARLSMFLVFLSLLFQGTSNLAGYSGKQIIFFYLTFNFIDSLAQFFFREVYSFRPLVVSGNFDFILLKPFNPLIKVLLGGADIMDLVMLVFISSAMIYLGITGISTNAVSWLMFILLVFNALLISAAFHIFVLGLGIITVSIDHLIMIYRDLTALMRVPVDLYTQPLRSLLTFVLPLGIMFTFPPKILMGLLSWQLIVMSFAIALISICLALLFWHHSLRYYQSASS
jgi:ABC-2 type transport system permease protein